MEEKDFKENVEEVVKEIDAEIEKLEKDAQEFTDEKFNDMGEEAKKAANVLTQAKDKLVEYVKKGVDQVKVKEAVDYVKKASTDLFNETEKKFNEFKNSEAYLNIKKTLDDASKNVNQVYNDASKAVSEAADKISKDENVQKFVSEVKDYSKQAYDAVKNSEAAKTVTAKVNETVEAVKNNETFKNAAETYDKIAKNASEVYNKAAKGVEDYLAKPEVKETIENVKKATSEQVDKAVTSLKKFFNKEEK